MFFVCTVLSASKKTKLASSNQKTFPSAGKNVRVVLVPCHTWKCVPTAIYGGVNIPKFSRCHMLQQMSSQ